MPKKATLSSCQKTHTTATTTWRMGQSGSFKLVDQSKFELIKKSEQNLQIFLDQVKKGEAELLGKSAFSRFVWDFIAGFMRLFKENPVLGGLIGNFF